MAQTGNAPRVLAHALALLTALGLTGAAAAESTAADDGYTTAPTAVLSVPAPGVLANDVPDELFKVVLSVNGLAFEGATTLELESGAVLTIRDDGSFDYDPTGIPAPAPASDSFLYTNFDTSRQEESPAATVTIDLGADPSPPVTAADDHYFVAVGALLDVAAPGILGNDSSQGGLLLVESVNGVVPEFPHPVEVAHGHVEVHQDGRIRFQHDGTPVGGDGDGEGVLDVFTYTATDGAGGSATATVTIEPTTAGGAGTVLNAFFDRLGMVTSTGEIGGSGAVQLTLAAEAASAVSIAYPGSTAGANVLVLRSSSQSFTQDAREVLRGCERLALVAQARPERYDLYVEVESTLASPFSGGGAPDQDASVTAEVASARVDCELRRAAAGGGSP